MRKAQAIISITDISNSAMWLSSGQLQLINLSHCERITDNIVIALGYG
jgi:hypothetical protein